MIDRKKTRLRPAVLSLDARVLPSSGLSASLAHGVLTVRGTSSADVISLNLVGRGGPASTLVVQGVAKYRLGKVQTIIVQGGEGNDSVAINDGGKAHLPVWIVEGSGNDSIVAGSGVASILVGNGNNTITASSQSTVKFGSGTNLIDGVLHTPPAPVTLTPAASTPSTPAATPTAPATPAAPTTPVAPTPVASTPTFTPTYSPGSPVLPSTPTPAAPKSTPAETVAQIIALTNSDRAANGLAPLTVDSRLMQAAQISAGNMASFQTMAHTIPGAADPTLQSRATAVGYNFTELGENIAAYFPDSASVETAWMASADHRANILEAAFTQIGVAVAFDSNNEPYYSVVFGDPSS